MNYDFFELCRIKRLFDWPYRYWMAIGRSAENDRGLFSGRATDAIIVALLLFIGLGLFACYQQHAALLPEHLSGDQVLPFFIIQRFPNGVSGLLIAAIFAAAMSSVDSGINSMSTVIVSDFVRPFRRHTAPKQKKKMFSWPEY